MSRKMQMIAGGLLSVAVLAVAAYAAAAYLVPSFRGSLEGKSGRSYEVRPAPELPVTQPDSVSTVMEVKDNSLIVRPLTKGDTTLAAPQLEVVLTASTQVYQDVTGGPEAEQHLVNGMIQQVVAPYDRQAIKPTDVIAAWGALRGERLGADVVVVYVGADDTGTPSP